MKKTSLLTIVFFVFFLGIHSNTHAQFGKLKSMAKSTAKKTAKSTAKKETTKADPKSSNSTSSASTSQTSREKLEASPAQRYIRDFRNNLSFGNLDKCTVSLQKIKELDPNWSELEQDQAAYDKLKKEHEKKVAESALSQKLSSYTESISWFEDKLYDYYRKVGATEKTYCDKLNKEEFLATKKKINESEFKTENHQKSIEKIEAFYATSVPKVKEYVLKDMKEGTSSLEYWSTENRKTEEFLKSFQKGSRPNYAIEKLNKTISYGKEFLKLAPDDTDVLALVQKQEAGIKELTVLSESDELKKLDALAHQRRIEKVRISPAQLSDSKLSAIATKKTTERGYGKVLRVSITSDWFVVKNELDLPKEKKILIETAHKAEDGKCYRVEGYLVRDYEGGGKYSSNILYQNKHQKEEMDCDNVNK